MEIRVFIVEDQKVARALVVDALATLGGFHVVDCAGGEAEATFWLDENSGGWDLCITDLLLEQGSGLGVISRCNADPHKGKVVVFSAYASPAVAQRCMTLGADAVFDKIETEQLLEWCRALGQREEARP